MHGHQRVTLIWNTPKLYINSSQRMLCIMKTTSTASLITVHSIEWLSYMSGGSICYVTMNRIIKNSFKHHAEWRLVYLVSTEKQVSYIHLGISETSEVILHLMPKLDNAPYITPLMNAKNWWGKNQHQLRSTNGVVDTWTHHINLYG